MKKLLVLAFLLVSTPAMATVDRITLGGSAGNLLLGTSTTITSPHRTGDTTTGLYSDTATSVSIGIGGSEKFRVDSTTGISPSLDIATGATASDAGDLISKTATGWTHIDPGYDNIASSLSYSYARTMFNELKVGNDVAINVLGDSTGDEDSEWVYQTGVNISAASPDYAVVYQLWNDTTQEYDQRRVISNGASGEHYIAFSGGGYRILSASDVTDVTGDLDITVDISLPDWTPSSTINICGKYGSSGAYSWRLRLDSTGHPILVWSADGTALITVTATSALSLSGNERVQLRATLDVDNGVAGNTVTFYYRVVSLTVGASANAWTQLGSPVVTAGTTSIFSSATAYTIGGVPAGQAVMNFYNIEIHAGIGGPLVHPAGLNPWIYGSGTYGTLTGSPTLHIINGSKSGADYTYFTDSTRKTKMIPPYHGAIAIVSDGHNEGSVLGAAWYTVLDTIKTAILAQNPYAKQIFITQNPTTKAVPIAWDWRMHAIRTWADKNSIAYIDTFKAFIDDGRALTDLIVQDDSIYVHPNAAGKVVETNAVSTTFLHQLAVSNF